MTPAPKRRWFQFSLALALSWAGLIFGTSCMVVSTDQLFTLVDSVVGPQLLQRFETFWGTAWFAVVKGWHVMEFAVLTTLLITLLNAWRPLSARRNVLWTALLAVLFAASDEFHQTYVPSRGGSVWDVLIDSLGVGIVVGIYTVKIRNTDPGVSPATH